MKPKYQQMVDVITKRISHGEYTDGQLPAVRILAEDLGVSYLTARKAVGELRDSGLVKYDDTNRKLKISTKKIKQLQVGAIMPFWNFSKWHENLQDVVLKLGGSFRFVSYSTATDPIITEALSMDFDLIFIALPFGDSANSLLLDRLARMADRVVVLFNDMSDYGLKSLLGAPSEQSWKIMDILKQRGVRSIDMISVNPGGNRDVKSREKAWAEYIKQNNLKGELHKKDITAFSRVDYETYDFLKTVVKKDNIPDAYFCATVISAVGLYRRLYDIGVVPGKDVSVFSFGEIEIAYMMSPPLAVVHGDGRENIKNLVRQYLPENRADKDDKLVYKMKEYEIYEGGSLVL